MRFQIIELSIVHFDLNGWKETQEIGALSATLREGGTELEIAIVLSDVTTASGTSRQTPEGGHTLAVAECRATVGHVPGTSRRR
jgi:hypothetical protein